MTDQPASPPEPHRPGGVPLSDPAGSPPIPDDLDEVLETIEGLPPASTEQGNPPDLARASARRAQAVRLRRDGATYEEIARIAGYSGKSAARQSVMRAFTRVEVESVTELRLLENSRLDADEVVLRTIIANAGLDPNVRLRAIDSRTRLSARRSRLNGLDAPLQVALSAGIAADLEDALAEAEAEMAAGSVPGEVTGVVDTPYDGLEDQRLEASRAARRRR